MRDTDMPDQNMVQRTPNGTKWVYLNNVYKDNTYESDFLMSAAYVAGLDGDFLSVLTYMTPGEMARQDPKFKTKVRPDVLTYDCHPLDLYCEGRLKNCARPKGHLGACKVHPLILKPDPRFSDPKP